MGTIWNLYALQRVDQFHVSSVILRNKINVAAMADSWEFFCLNTWKFCWGTIWKLYVLQQDGSIPCEFCHPTKQNISRFNSIPKKFLRRTIGTCMLYNKWIDSM